MKLYKNSKSQKKFSTNGNNNNIRHEDNITTRIDDSDRSNRDIVNQQQQQPQPQPQRRPQRPPYQVHSAYANLPSQQSSQYREQTDSMYSSSTEPPFRRRKTQQSVYTFEQLKQSQQTSYDSNRPPPLPPQELPSRSPSIRRQSNVDDDNTAPLTCTPKEKFVTKISKPHYTSQPSKPSCPPDYNKLPKSDCSDNFPPTDKKNNSGNKSRIITNKNTLDVPIIKPKSSSTSLASSEEYKFSTTTKQDGKKEEEDNRLECMICLEKRHKKGFLQITNTCSHEKIICRNCIRSHIGTRLDEKGDINITCPVTGCGQLITYDNVKRLVRKEMFERFDLLTTRQGLNSMPDFRWCKNPSCGSGQIHANRENAPIVTCQICKARSCYVHDIPWHENMSCAEYDKSRKDEETATLDYLTRETKPCPKCGVRISKNGGCNHMACKVSSCKYEFCWLCMADFDEIRKHGNDRHQPSCQLYA